MDSSIKGKKGLFEGVREGIRQRGFNTVPAVFIIVYHVFLAIGLVWYFAHYTPSFSLCMATIALFFLSGISITGGYHRYYAHTTYKTNPIVECFLLFFASMAAQASALRWSFDHRLHHSLVDTDDDPYSINKGFWYAHVLWICEKPRPIEKKVVADLYRNKLVMFQHTYYKYCMVASNLIAFLVVGYACNDFLGAFILAWWARLCLLHHSTWFINSLAHTWGSRYYSKEQSAVDNYIISFLTCGEGYHNYHHTFANDYRNGVRWFHFDPTKWMIWTLSKLGLASGLKQVSRYHIKEKMILARKEELIHAIQHSKDSKCGKDELIQKAESMCEDILDTLKQSKQLHEKYKQAKMMKDAAVSNVREELKAVQKAVQKKWKVCQAFSKHFLRKSLAK